MDNILSSNNTSVILRSLAEAETTDLSYEIPHSYPLLAKQYREISPNSWTASAPNGQEVSFNITKANLLNDMQIKTFYTPASTGLVVTQHLGLNLFEWIQLRTNNKVILTLSDTFIIARTEHSQDHVKNAIYRRSVPLLIGTEASSVAAVPSCTYTPVFSSFFEDIKNSFDLNFYEQLSLVGKFNTAARGGINETLSITDVKLWVWSYRPDDKYADMLRAKNQNPSKPLNELAWNTFTERFPCTGTNTTTVRLNVNYPVFKSYIMVRPITAALVGASARIDSLDFSVGGTKLLESVPHVIANWESAKNGSCDMRSVFSSGAYAYETGKSVCLEFGMRPDVWTANTGALSFNQINYPAITVNYATLTAADYEVVVTHVYWNLLTLDSGNGSVQISVSS